ncbi:MAG: hypothetical protein ABSC11_10620 [Smithella sp.]
MTAYDAFWWQCIKEKSVDLEKQCEATCNGTSCATYGCSEGGYDAEWQVNESIKKYGREQTKKYLEQLLNSGTYKQKVAPYF